MSITLRQLRYLEALGAERHFGRAAAACHVTQPALSTQIRELETTLGLALVERAPRGVSLTPAGEAALERARGILRAVDDLADFARAETDGLSGRMRLGVIPTIAPYLLPRLLSRAAEAFPRMSLEIRESRTEPLVAALHDGALDLVLAAVPVAGQGESLAAAALFEDRFLMLRQADAAPEAVAAAPLLLLEEGHCLRDQALAALPLGADRAVSRFGASSLATLVEMVASGMGVTLIPQMSAAVETRGRRVVASPCSTPAPRRLVGLLWRKSSPRGPAFESFAEMARGLAPPPNEEATA